jgi:hypothetical protein
MMHVATASGTWLFIHDINNGELNMIETSSFTECQVGQVQRRQLRQRER